ncbi:E3 ubiquitin-protein ligase MIB1-like [Abrus precatorius]|uniref:E3 ubiquitin-protein ligase MIB1-like n=1 Tax=Abrus precatorius TaxID=3816 RepID=A0A8B8JRT1_ABRPR|nr:E3 ubiquitin-protein ligase MIB1-like [Abrus precatorius]
MAPSCFPLRWESTGEQWWYASPIDWASANGYYDLVVELLHLDTNLLIKLTSLRRIRRLETVWDDVAQFGEVAKCRSQVARNLMMECETGPGHNSLIRAGYGGWLLYTAASAGDVDFVRELLGRYPSLVFGEGEYGVTDILYAAARSHSCEVFKVLLDSALSPRECESGGAQVEEVFKRDMVNRAIHAAARGGNWEMLKQLVGSASGVLGYRDAQGFTVLHTAAGRGQVQVVRNLLASVDIINLTDAQGNTALHVASYRGHLPVVDILVLASPSVALLTNHYGDTFLHMAVAGFRSPGFSRLDKHTELMKQLVSGKIVNMQNIINVKNNDGRTALHVSLIDNIQFELVEMLMSVPSIDLNICDAEGMTPLDILKQRPKSASSDILIKRMISAGGISNCKDAMTGNTLFTHHKTNVIGGSPGTSFRIPDAEIFLYTGIENSSDANYDQASVESYSCSNELGNFDSANSPCNKKSNPVNHATSRLKFLLRWPRRRETKAATSELEDDDCVDPLSSSTNYEEFPISLRERYSQSCSLPNNKRTQSMRTSLPSPSSKMKFTTGLMHGVIQLKPQFAHSSPSPFQDLSVASLSSINKQKGVDVMGPSCSNRSIDDGTLLLNYKQCSFNKKLMNRYFSFGAQGLAVEDSNSCTKSNGSYKRFGSLVA